MSEKGKTKPIRKNNSGTKRKQNTSGREISWMDALTIGSWPIILSLLLLIKQREPSALDVGRLLSLPIAIFFIELVIISTGRVRSVGGAILASLIAAVLGFISFMCIVANTMM